MRVVVTGGLGFVGHAVTRGLVRAGHDVVVLSSRLGARSRVEGVRTVHADVRDVEALRRELPRLGPQAVCHLAALTRVRDSFESPVSYYDVNVGGTAALLDALASLPPMPVVFTSTGAVYGHARAASTRTDRPTRRTRTPPPSSLPKICCPTRRPPGP